MNFFLYNHAQYELGRSLVIIEIRTMRDVQCRATNKEPILSSKMEPDFPRVREQPAS